MELICDYMRDETLRHALNELTVKTFGFDFEGWVTGGYFEGDYIPYSFIEDGKIIANVSANRMQFLQNGVMKNYIQLGTVMTDEAYRRQGLAAKLMKHVIETYGKTCDGIYLFGNLESLGFYRKMGFLEGAEYRYCVKPDILSAREKDATLSLRKELSAFVPVDPSDDSMRAKYMDAVRKSVANSSLEQMNKFGLQMFYTMGLDGVFYAEDIDCFIVTEQEESTLILNSIISNKPVSLSEILKRINSSFTECKLGFAPLPEDREMCDAERYDGGDDYRFFYIGEELESIEKERLYFPEFSHA